MSGRVASLQPERWSLRVRLIAASSLALALTGAMLVTALTWRAGQTARDEMEERLDSELRTVSALVLDQAVVGDYTLIQRILDERVHDDDVAELRWEAPKGIELVAKRPPEKSLEVPPAFVALLRLEDQKGKQSLELGGVGYGVVEARVSAVTAYDHLWDGFVTGWQILGVALLANGLLISLLVSAGLWALARAGPGHTSLRRGRARCPLA